jgi:hypothetical protein
MPADPQILDTLRNKLTSHGLPAQLLPATATQFTHDPATGRFTVQFDRDTVLEPGGYQVTYAKQVRGKLAHGSIVDLEGVTVKVAFTRPAITSIVLEPDGRQLTFSVAGLKRSVPRDAFDG